MTPEPAYTDADVRRARRMARLVIEHFFGARPRRLIHRASGLSNSVFEVDHAEGAFIVRIAPDAARLPVFLKEQWCVERVRAAGVPVAEILEVGQGVIPSPYMIQRLERGEEATHHAQRVATLRELGRFARLVNSIETEGFGETFDWSSNRLSFNSRLEDWLAGDFDWLGRVAGLERHDMLSERQASALRAAVRQMIKRAPGQGTLAHGDLRLKNVLVDGAGAIRAILDWEHCCSAIAPVWDLAIALHDLSIDAKQAFIAGYGLSRRELDEHAPAIKALNILHYAPHVERAIEAGDAELVESYRVRLSGALDLYSL